MGNICGGVIFAVMLRFVDGMRIQIPRNIAKLYFVHINSLYIDINFLTSNLRPSEQIQF